MYRVIAFAFISLMFNSVAQTTKKACFLGNSYTSVNNLPAIVDSLANHNGNDLVKDANTPGGYTFEGHTANAISLNKISSNTWDYVILQEQSQRPSFPSVQVAADVYPYAEILSDSIRSANECAIPLFYNTWGRRSGDPQWDSINTFVKMNNRLYAAYSYMAENNRGMLAPVGIGFRHVFEDAAPPVSFTSLYAGDGSHPSIFGSYLTACIFYNVIFEESPVGNTYVPNGISIAQSSYLQDVAFHVVNEVDSVKIDYAGPLSDFSFTQVGSFVNFTSQSTSAVSYHWDFGDNTSATYENPSHNYSEIGTYTVTLTASYCGKSTEFSQDITVTVLDVKDDEVPELSIYPNPSNGQVNILIKGTELQDLILYAIDGKIIKNYSQVSGALQLKLVPGTYLLKSNRSAQKIIVTQ